LDGRRPAQHHDLVAELRDSWRRGGHHARREGLANQGAQLPVLRWVHAHEVALGQQIEVALVGNDLAEVRRERARVGQHALRIGIPEHLPDSLLFVVVDRSSRALAA